MKRAGAAAALLMLAGCAAPHRAQPVRDTVPPPSPPVRAVSVAPDRGTPIEPGLWVSELADGVWRFVAQDDPAAAEPIDANGLIVRVGPQAVLVDTGWNSEQVDALIEWTGRMFNLPVRAAIVTHFHADRAGGVERCLERGLTVEMLDSTAARLGVEHRDGVLTFANLADFPASARRIELDWPGAGHTRDNITVWIADVKLLFGGCLVKSAAATTLGNVADADLRMWPVTLRALQRRYPDAAIVVPGHGAVGDSAILTHTLQLLEKSRQ